LTMCFVWFVYNMCRTVVYQVIVLHIRGKIFYINNYWKWCVIVSDVNSSQICLLFMYILRYKKLKKVLSIKNCVIFIHVYIDSSTHKDWRCSSASKFRKLGCQNQTRP
jgi:hypothetical protein